MRGGGEMGNALAGMASFFLLWVLSVIGAFAVVPSWAYPEPEYEEGVLTSGGRCMSRARLLLTSGALYSGFAWSSATRLKETADLYLSFGKTIL